MVIFIQTSYCLPPHQPTFPHHLLKPPPASWGTVRNRCGSKHGLGLSGAKTRVLGGSGGQGWGMEVRSDIHMDGIFIRLELVDCPLWSFNDLTSQIPNPCKS